MSKIYCFDAKKYNVILKTLCGRQIIEVRNKISLYLNCTLKDGSDNTIEINNNLEKAISKYLKVDNTPIEKDKLKDIEYATYIELGDDYIYVKNDSILKNTIKIVDEESKHFLYSDKEGLDFILTDKIEFYLEDKKYSELGTELQNNYKGIIDTITNTYKSNYSNNTVIDEILKNDKLKNYVKNVEYFINDEKKISLKVDFKDPFNSSKIVFKDSDDKEITNQHIIDYINNVVIKYIKLELKNLTNFEDKLNYIKENHNSFGFKIDLKLEDNSIVFNVKKNEGVDEIALYLDYLIMNENKEYINFIKDLYNNEKDEKPQKKWGFYTRLLKSYYKHVKNEEYLDECINIIKSLGEYYSKFKDIFDRICALKDILNEDLKKKVLETCEDLKKISDVKNCYMNYLVIDYFSSNFADTIKYDHYDKRDYISSNGNDLTFKIITHESGKYKLSDYKISVLQEIKNIKILDDLKDEIIKQNELYVKNLIDSNLEYLESVIFKKYKDNDLNELNRNDFKNIFNEDFDKNIKEINKNIVKLIKKKLLKKKPYKAEFKKLETDEAKEKYTTSIYKRYKNLLSKDFLSKNFQDDEIAVYLEFEIKGKILLSLFQNQYLKKIETYKFDNICKYMLNTSYELKYDNFKKKFEDDFINLVNKFVHKQEILEKIKKSICFLELDNKLNEKFNILIKPIIRQFTDNEIKKIEKFTKINEVDNYENKEKGQFKTNLIKHISTKSDYFNYNYTNFNKDSTNLLFNNDNKFIDPYFNKINIKLNEKRTKIEDNVKIDNEEANKLYNEMIKVVNDIKNDLDTKITKLTKFNLESYEFKTEDKIKNYINEELKRIDNFADRYNNYSKIKTSEGQNISSLINSKISSVSSLLKQNYELKVNEISIVKINYTLLNEDQFNENVKTQYNSFINNEENKKFDSRKKYKDLYNFIISKFNFIENVLKDDQSIKDSEDVINVDDISLILILKEEYKKTNDDHKDDDEHNEERNDDDDDEHNEEYDDNPNKKEKKDQNENNDSTVPSDIIKEPDNKKGCCACSGGNKTKSESKTKSSKKSCC